MKRVALATTLILSNFLNAQKGHDIRINFTDCPDSTVYLARYFWDQYPIEDSCKHIRDGKIRFSGTESLTPGVYFIANQAKNSFYFQFIVDKDQDFTINVDNKDIIGSQKANEKQNQEFFSYVRFMTGKSDEIEKLKAANKGQKDSVIVVASGVKTINEQVEKFDADFMKRNKGTFVADLMNLKAERVATNIPKASNGRPDSVYQFYYYRSHYFDGVNFADDRLLSTPFFAPKVKKYFEQLVPQVPDSVIAAIDVMMGRIKLGTDMYRTIVAHLAYKFEQNKTLIYDKGGRPHSFEKVFVHVADKYIADGKMRGIYDEETEKKILDKINIVRHLLPGENVPDLYVVDSLDGSTVLKMGFDTARTSAGATYLYQKNLPRLQPMFRNLYGVSAKYTVLVFWAADCDHCKKEVPKLHEELKRLKGKVDVSVFAVQTKHELYDSWKKFIAEKKLTDFIHGFDPVHINNLKEQYDIEATPVIYLLDRDKRIMGKKISADQVADIISNLEKIAMTETK